MLASEPNIDTHRSSSKNKENRHSLSQIDSLKSLVGRYEQALIDIRRQLKQKVNKNDFLVGLSSKVSLSDITNISSDLQPSEQPSKQRIREEVQKEVANALQNIKVNHSQIATLRQAVQKLTTQVNTIEQSNKRREDPHVKELREADQSIIQRLEKKAQRSELDKMMHLSSLLAIQFQLIKKRFGTFEVDYNLIWKEISALYTHQESLRSVFQTERKDSFENTKQKQLQVMLQTCKDQKIVGKLFADKEQVRPFESIDADPSIAQLNEKVQSLQRMIKDQEFSIKSFSQRLLTIEMDYENQSQLIKQIKQLKKDYNNSKEQITFLEDRHRKLKEDVEEIVGEKCSKGLKEMGSNIGQQIREACEQITSKMMDLFEHCSKVTDITALKKEITNVQLQSSDKIEALSEISKKRLDTLGIRYDQHDDKLRLMARDIANRLKIQEFDQIRQAYITSEASVALVKKTESHIKKQMAEFKQSQKSINDVVCSQTILARWIWVSGQLKCGNLVSWDRQAVNTLPDNFIYVRPEMTFRITSSGIYRLEMGFYAKKKPSIQIIINGKVVVSAVNSSSYVVHHSSGKLKDIANSEVAGLTYYDFFTLQQNSRLAIAYTGQPGHGFFGIQRL